MQHRPVVIIDETVTRWITAIKVPVLGYGGQYANYNSLTKLARHERFVQANNPQRPVTATDAEVLMYLHSKSKSDAATEADRPVLGYLFYRLHERYPHAMPAPSQEIADYYWHFSSDDRDRLTTVRNYLQRQKAQLSQIMFDALFESTHADAEAYIDTYFIQLLDYLEGDIDDHGP